MTPPDTGSAPIITLNRVVAFDLVVVKGVGQDSQGRPSLRIGMTGAAEGQAGDQLVIAAFFYDQNAQIESQMRQTPYSSKDGKLSVAITLTLTAIRQPFDLTLEIPLAAFPSNLTGGAQFHCVAFYGDQRIGESKVYTPVSAETSGARHGHTTKFERPIAGIRQRTARQSCSPTSWYLWQQPHPS